MSVKRHLVILLVLTVLIRGVMFVSYPMGGQDENQGYNRYLVSKILNDDLQIGNLRYSPGYPLFIAPFAALGELFGRFDERVVLLAQLALAAAIPFLLYDIIRARHSPKAAFFIALLSLVDPFGLQWAHFSLPIWLVASCLVFSLWLLHHAERRGDWRLVIAAGLIAGWGVLGRWNFSPVVVGIGCLLLFVGASNLRQRLMRFFVFGFGSLLLILIVHLTIQVPATGVWSFSCISGINLVESLEYSGLETQMANGPHSERLLRLGALPPLPENRLLYGYYPLFSGSNFSRWVTAGPWATDEEREAFTNQVSAEIPEPLSGIHTLADWLYYYLGPCETDRMLRGVYFETIRAAPIGWLLGIFNRIPDFLWPTLTMEKGYPDYALPPNDTVEYERAGGVFGFMRAMEHEASYYNGHWVWRPGIELFTLLWAPLNALRFLVFPALVWALFTRWRIYSALAFLLLLYVIVISTVDAPPEPRIYAIVYPLGPVLVGGLLLAVWERLRPILGR